jgi:hypothetical protein
VRDQRRCEINNDFSWSGSFDYGIAVSRPDLP